jgi:hypothetical protein
MTDVSSFTGPLPPSLVEQLRRMRVVPFIGAGISVGAGLPDWEQLLRELLGYANQHGLSGADGAQIEEALATRQFELAAEGLVKRLGPHFSDGMALALRKPNVAPTTVHQLLARVKWPAVITTNYDDLLPNVLQTSRTLTWKDDSELGAALRRGESHLLLAHGCLDRPETIVLTVAHYRECLRHAAYRTYLKVMCTQYTLLFLGFSFTDRDVQGLLEDFRHEFGHAEIPHFALTQEDQVGQLRADNLRTNFNIQVVPYQTENGQHSAVERILGTIIESCPAEQIIDKAAGLQEITNLTNRRALLTAEEYLNQFATTCRELARLGYLRTSCVALAQGLDEVKNEVPLLCRVTHTLALIDLLIADEQYWSAGRRLQELSGLPLKEHLPPDLLKEFVCTWFETGIANYDPEMVAQAVNLAREINFSEDMLSAIDARLELLNFLHGAPWITPGAPAGISA